MVCIAYYIELNVQICNYAQKQRICRENSKYAPDENFCGHCGCQLLPPCIPIILMVSPTQAPLSCSYMSHSCFYSPQCQKRANRQVTCERTIFFVRIFFDMRSTLQSGWTLLLLTLTRVLSTIGHGCALGETCVQVEQIDSTLWFNALARIIRQLCLKVNLYGVLVFNIPGLQNGLNTFQQECCRPGHFWGEDQSWRSPNKCHYVKVSFFASWCFLS